MCYETDCAGPATSVSDFHVLQEDMEIRFEPFFRTKFRMLFYFSVPIWKIRRRKLERGMGNVREMLSWTYSTWSVSIVVERFHQSLQCVWNTAVHTCTFKFRGMFSDDESVPRKHWNAEEFTDVVDGKFECTADIVYETAAILPSAVCIFIASTG